MGVNIYIGNADKICLHCGIKTLNFCVTAIRVVLYRTYGYKVGLSSAVGPFGSFGIDIADVVVYLIKVIVCRIYMLLKKMFYVSRETYVFNTL